MKSLIATSSRGDAFHATNVEGGENNIPETEGRQVVITLCRSRQRDADMKNVPRETLMVTTDVEGLRFLHTQLGRFLDE